MGDWCGSFSASLYDEITGANTLIKRSQIVDVVSQTKKLFDLSRRGVFSLDTGL
jgi:hypothetical protein